MSVSARHRPLSYSQDNDVSLDAVLAAAEGADDGARVEIHVVTLTRMWHLAAADPSEVQRWVHALSLVTGQASAGGAGGSGVGESAGAGAAGSRLSRVNSMSRGAAAAAAAVGPVGGALTPANAKGLIRMFDDFHARLGVMLRDRAKLYDACVRGRFDLI